jgi:hypothetical protein
MIIQDLRAFLTAAPSVTSLLSSASAIYPQFIPQVSSTGYPALTLSQDTNEDDWNIDATSSLKTALVSIDTYAYSYITAHTIAAAIRAALVGYSKGAFGSVTADQIRCERELDLYESDTFLHRVSQQYFISYL